MAQEELWIYYSRFCRYMTSIQGPILQRNNEMEWLREATNKFPLLSAVKYAET